MAKSTAPISQAQKSRSSKMVIEEITVDENGEEVEEVEKSAGHKKSKADKESYAVRKTKAQANLLDAGPAAEEKKVKKQEVKSKPAAKKAKKVTAD